MKNLIFANSGSGKTTLIEKLGTKKVSDTDIISCKLFNCEYKDLYNNFKKLTPKTRELHYLKIKMVVKMLEQVGVTVFTPTRQLLKDCSLCILQPNYSSIDTITGRENPYYQDRETFDNKIKTYMDICHKYDIPMIMLKPNHYLSDVVSLDKNGEVKIND